MRHIKPIEKIQTQEGGLSFLTPIFFRKKIMIITGVIAIIVLAVVMWAKANDVFVSWKKVATFDLGQGRALVISADTAWEGRQHAFYQVVANKNALIRRTMLDYSLSDHSINEFQVVWSNDGNTVGLVSRIDPYTVIALYSLSTGESWPFAAETEKYPETWTKGKKLLSSLNAGRTESGVFILKGTEK